MPAAILHLLGSAQLEETGPARIVAALASGLDREKYQVHAWCLGAPGPLVGYLQSAGAEARSVDWSQGLRDPLGAYRFWRLIRDHDFAIVHHHFGGRMARRIVRASSNARLVVHLHARIQELDSARRIPVAVQGADLVIAVSKAVARQIQQPKPIVVYSGVEVRHVPREPISPGTEVVVGASGRLVDIKGLSYLIKALAILSSEFPDFQVEIAGDGPERENLENYARELNLKERVRFLGWQTDLEPVLRRWDIFAMPSLTEGFPMAALEAMAQGLPVVATNVGGLPELVEDGGTGILVPPSDAEALANGLRSLIVDTKRMKEMGVAGWRRARDQFSINRMVAQTASIYDSLLTSQK
ncbi:glycosyltransferase family 4 protein [Telmatobacter sp. DSM 110680]|uniref:Glycosyltransferase family 4 protein n=1 Tax=Telmatobacter sp. DSM 110680 TaxID=3036704 RepID=A0AAU7DL55_9BACT